MPPSARHFLLLGSLLALVAVVVGAFGVHGLGARLSPEISGSLYALALSGEKWLGAVAPAGGTAFILGWGAFAWAFVSAEYR